MRKRPQNRSRKPRLTPYQRRVAELKAKHPDMPLPQLGRLAGSKAKKDNTVASSVVHTLAKPSAQQRWREIMAKTPGLRDEDLLKTLNEGLKAKKTVFFADKGRVIESRNCVDHATRATYLDLAAKVQGATVNKVEVSGPDGGPIQEISVLKGLTEAQLKKLADEL